MLLDQALAPYALLVIRKEKSGSWGAPVQVARDAGKRRIVAAGRPFVRLRILEGRRPGRVGRRRLAQNRVLAGARLGDGPDPDRRRFRVGGWPDVLLQEPRPPGARVDLVGASLGGTPRQVVRFDAARQSIRGDFAVGAGRILHHRRTPGQHRRRRANPAAEVALRPELFPGVEVVETYSRPSVTRPSFSSKTRQQETSELLAVPRRGVLMEADHAAVRSGVSLRLPFPGAGRHYSGERSCQ